MFESIIENEATQIINFGHKIVNDYVHKTF
jgi:hypothetical protein